MRPATLAISVAALGAALSFAEPARAHLIPGGQGTLNVVGESVFAVLSVPITALHDADDDGDGVVDMGEFQRHEATLRAEIDRRFAISDGTTSAVTVRVDLVLSPQHDAARDRADQIVALKHARFEAAPRDLRLQCDLFGTTDADRKLTFTATRHPASGTETDTADLVPGATEHAFFAPVPPPRAAGLGGDGSSRGLLPLVGLFGAAIVLSTVSARRKRAVRGDRRRGFGHHPGVEQRSRDRRQGSAR